MNYNCPSCGADLKSAKIKTKFIRPSSLQQQPTQAGWYTRCPYCETIIVRNVSDEETYLRFFSGFSTVFVARFCESHLHQYGYNNWLSATITLVIVFMIIWPTYLLLKRKIKMKESYWVIYEGRTIKK